MRNRGNLDEKFRLHQISPYAESCGRIVGERLFVNFIHSGIVPKIGNNKDIGALGSVDRRTICDSVKPKLQSPIDGVPYVFLFRSHATAQS